MITFDAISKIAREEKNTTKLVTLPEGFLDDVRTYLNKKEQMDSDPIEIQSARSELKSLFEIREFKIIKMSYYFVRSGVIPGNMTPEERAFFNSVVNAIKNFQKSRKQSMEGDEIKKDVVALLEDIPEFVGMDMRNYGPFNKGDVATVPEQNSKVLIDQKKAKKLDIEAGKR